MLKSAVKFLCKFALNSDRFLIWIILKDVLRYTYFNDIVTLSQIVQNLIANLFPFFSCCLTTYFVVYFIMSLIYPLSQTGYHSTYAIYGHKSAFS